MSQNLSSTAVVIGALRAKYESRDKILCILGNLSADYFKKAIKETIVKQFGFRSGPTFCFEPICLQS